MYKTGRKIQHFVGSSGGGNCVALVDLLMLTERCNKVEPISAREEARNEAPTDDIVAEARSKLPAIGSSIVFLHIVINTYMEKRKIRYQNFFLFSIKFNETSEQIKTQK